MKSKSTTKSFVNIRIGSPESPKFREVKLSRFQFELALIALPTLVMWGIISTTILVVNKNALSINNQAREIATSSPAQSGLSQTTAVSTRPAPMPAERKPPSLPATPARSASVTSATIQAAADSVAAAEASIDKLQNMSAQPPALGRALIKINGFFAVNAAIMGDLSKGQFNLKLTTINLSGKHQSGHFWVNVRAISKSGEDIWYTINQNMSIDGDGHTDSPENGIRFSFRHTREQTLPLIGPSEEITRFAEIIVGFANENSQQFIGKSEF